jgi:hypothetical protein
MRNKYLSLILVMMTVLIAPAFVTSCYHQVVGQDDPPAAVAVSDTLQQAQDDVAPAVAPAIAPADTFGWQNILIVVLGLFSTMFAALWKRARNAIAAIAEALKDGNVDQAELNNILKAWKG